MQKISNALATRRAISYFQTKHDDEGGFMGMNLLPNKYQQRFSNISYTSDNVTVNYTLSLPQQLLNLIQHNRKKDVRNLASCEYW